MENALIFKQILPTNSLRKCMVISLENLYVDIGAQRVKRSLRVSSSAPFEDKLVHRVWSLEN